LSHGQRAGLHLASTLAIEPELLMLDDPATGLDPAARRSLLEAMIYFTRDRERTIFFSTHLLDDVERVADHVAILDYSILRTCSSMETFRERVQQFVVQFSGEPPQQLPEIPGLLRVTRNQQDLTLIIANHNGRTEQVLESLGALAINELPLSLEDALTAYVGRQGSKSLISTTGETI
jgi:ABC-2 type transport system ATP-binding protein